MQEKNKDTLHPNLKSSSSENKVQENIFDNKEIKKNTNNNLVYFTIKYFSIFTGVFFMLSLIITKSALATNDSILSSIPLPEIISLSKYESQSNKMEILRNTINSKKKITKSIINQKDPKIIIKEIKENRIFWSEVLWELEEITRYGSDKQNEGDNQDVYFKGIMDFTKKNSNQKIFHNFYTIDEKNKTINITGEIKVKSEKNEDKKGSSPFAIMEKLAFAINQSEWFMGVTTGAKTRRLDNGFEIVPYKFIVKIQKRKKDDKPLDDKDDATGTFDIEGKENLDSEEKNNLKNEKKK